MRDLTVLIPVRVDSLVRLENVLAVIRYLYRYFDVNLMVQPIGMTMVFCVPYFRRM